MNFTKLFPPRSARAGWTHPAWWAVDVSIHREQYRVSMSNHHGINFLNFMKPVRS